MKNGYDRFLGFADIYDEGRPHLPGKAIEILNGVAKGPVVDENIARLCKEYGAGPCYTAPRFIFLKIFAIIYT